MASSSSGRSISGITGITLAAKSNSDGSVDILATMDVVLRSEDMGEIRARILLLTQRNEAMGPPLPTAAHPLPPENAACKLCRRVYRKTRNPYGGKGKSPFLCPQRAGALECQTCRNVKNWAFAAWEIKDLERKCNSDDGFCCKYLLLVLIYEDKRTDPKGAIVKSVSDLPTTLGAIIVIASQAVTIKGTMQLGVLWPVDVYKFHEGRDPPKSLIKDYEFDGKIVKGIKREPSHGNPIGTIKLEKEVADGITKYREVANSSTAPRGAEQAEEVFAAARNHANLDVKVVGRGADDDPESLGVQLKLQSQKNEEMDSFLNDLWSASMLQSIATGTPKKRSAASSSTSNGANPSPSDSSKKPRVSRGGGDAAARSNQLGLSEQVVLKAKLIVQDLTQDSTVMQQGVKKLDNILASIASRMSDKIMEYYAADYGHQLKSEPWILAGSPTEQATAGPQTTKPRKELSDQHQISGIISNIRYQISYEILGIKSDIRHQIGYHINQFSYISGYQITDQISNIKARFPRQVGRR